MKTRSLVTSRKPKKSTSSKWLALAALALLLNAWLAPAVRAGISPTVTTLAATGVTASNATLNGTVNPNGADTSAYFEYGLSTQYGNVGTLTFLPATNTTVTLPGFVVSSVLGAAGAQWTQSSAPSEYWQSIASSVDGSRLAAVVYGGGIYTSTNSGGTWAKSSAPGEAWSSIASSADGALLAVVGGGYIYTSTNSGGTWTPSSVPYKYWSSIASSADGTRLAAGINGGGIYSSTNSGGTWALSSAPSTSWMSIASSADGTRLAAASDNGIYTSTNSGGTWALSSAPSENWYSIASSADGTRLAAGIYGGGIYTSTNSGGTWTPSSAPGKYWQSIASSADGTRLAAAVWVGGLYTSTDSGLTWTQSSAPSGEWSSIASSADGARLAAVIYSGGIYTSTGAASGLLAGTTYHYQLVGMNSAGAALGGDQTFTTSAGAPVVCTLLATGVAETNATLNGTVNTGGLSTTAYFQYGLTTSYGSYSATNSLAGTDTTLPLPSLFSSLLPDTTYHYQLVGSNDAGTSLGGDQTFSTSVGDPLVTTLSATGVTETNATLNGTINPGGLNTMVYIEYGLTTDYGNLGPLALLPATNATVSLPGWVVSSLTGSAGAQWTPSSAASEWWTSIAASADGTRLAAVSFGGGIYTSTNSGGTWTQSSAPSEQWTSIASSADGTRLAAGVEYGYIYTSTNSGGTWTQSGAPSEYWQSIASSADGRRLAAAQHYPGYIYTSTDSGGTWTPSSAPTEQWSSIASSADGTRLAAVAYEDENNNPGSIFTSTDSGGTWTPSSAPSEYWQSIASSADGRRLAAVVEYADANYDPGSIFTSTDSGGTWTQSSALSQDWYSIASSADGTQLAAGGAGGGIYTSTGAVSMLLPGTTYHYQLVGLNSAGATLGGDQTLTTSVGAPLVATLPASGVTATDATLNGTVNPGGFETTAYFQDGLTTSYGSSCATNSLAATNITLSVSSLIGSLSPGTTYHYQLVGRNGAGATPGADQTFTTSVAAPSVPTLSATGVTATNATLNGTINPNGAATTAYFEYGLTTDYGDLGPVVLLPAGNATVSMPGFVVSSLTGAAGAQWSQSGAPSEYWYSIASSADGTQLAAAVHYGGGIYISTNSGGTWVLSSAPTENRWAIVSSADGTRLAAAAYADMNGNPGTIFTSTDNGGTWTQSSAPSEYWQAISSSADGTQLAAVVSGGGIYTSTDSGGTWTPSSAPWEYWASISSSADGTQLAAVAYGDGIYTSTDSGGTWTPSSAPSEDWQSIASSADGTQLAAVAYSDENGNPGSIFTSTDSGLTWTPSSAPTEYWQSIASSADGTRLAAAANYDETGNNPGSIFTSTNSGGTWTQSSVPSEFWYSIASSADGTQLAAAASYDENGNPGTIFISTGAVSLLLPGMTYHYQLVGINSAGATLGGDQTFTTIANQPAAVSFACASCLTKSRFQLSFTNLSGLGFTVLGSTSLALPLANWPVLGAVVESPSGSGQYQFTDLQATSNVTRFYRVRSP